MSDKGFIIKWQADDGYADGARPQRFEFDPENLTPNMSEDEIESLFFEEIDIEFERNVSAIPLNKEEFMEWARAIVKKKKEKENADDME